METLESRLISLLKRPSSSLGSQRLTSSSAMSMMMPTPGMPHAGNPNATVTSSLDVSASATNSVQTAPVTSSTLLPTGGLPNGTLNRADGNIPIF